MILRAHVETIPADNSGQGATDVRDVELEAATFEEGMTALRAQLAEGERLITIRVAER